MPIESGLGRAVINFSSSGDNILVPAVSGKNIQVVKIFLLCGAATNLTFKDGATALTGPLPFSANTGLALDESEANVPWMAALSGNLILNSSNAVQVSGLLIYTQV